MKKQSQLPATLTHSSDENLTLGRIAIQDFAEARVLERLSMYERRIELSLFRTMAELQKLRLLRKAEEAEAAVAEPFEESDHPHLDKKHRDEAATQSQLDKKVKMKKQSQIRPDLSTPLRLAQDDKEKKRLEKQSQFSDEEYELSAFEKKEYELLTSIAPGPNKANRRPSAGNSKLEILNLSLRQAQGRL